MADALPIPDDLPALHVDLSTAQQAVDAYGRKVDTERREMSPGEDQWRERAV